MSWQSWALDCMPIAYEFAVHPPVAEGAWHQDRGQMTARERREALRKIADDIAERMDSSHWPDGLGWRIKHTDESDHDTIRERFRAIPTLDGRDLIGKPPVSPKSKSSTDNDLRKSASEVSEKT